jgi:hypothetical protein
MTHGVAAVRVIVLMAMDSLEKSFEIAIVPNDTGIDRSIRNRIPPTRSGALSSDVTPGVKAGSRKNFRTGKFSKK